MKDFVKTIEFVTRYNDMVGDVERCVFADKSTSSHLIEQMYMEHGDNAVNMPAKTMGDWEREQFEESTTKLESKLGELRGELLDLCPSIDDMPQYYQVWERILLGMNSPEKAWWEERMNERFWKEKGVSDACEQVACTFAVIGLQSLLDKVQRMMADVRQRYGIKAAQSTENDGAVQLPTDCELNRFRVKYDGLIKNMETFLVDIHTMKPRELAKVYKKQIKPSFIPLTDFFKDIEKIAPERNGQRGWTYDNIVKCN